ncbi:MAG: SUMF1/EgtB/PvdO family nonheme iron enzyme [Saccharothrix sp.]|nr:SUMF1/EgtB/PvdO family nonheme iron enzyme [Saccharothrix sp.]
MPDHHGEDSVVLPAALVRDLLDFVTDRYPTKSFGYLVAPPGQAQPTEFVGFDDNVRNTDRWRADFELRGRYFVDHPDAGFVATEEESWRVQKQLIERDLHEVAIFHTHRRHPGNFSGIDYDLHISRFTRMWHLIISLRNPRQPQIRAFAVSEEGVRELRVVSQPRPDDRERDHGRSLDAAMAALALDRHGRPRCRDSAAVLRAVHVLEGSPDRGPYEEHVVGGLLSHAEERFDEFVAPDLVRVDGGAFDMGSAPDAVKHFCGEAPRHRVVLSPFLLSRFAVTNGLYGRFDPERATSAAERDLPVVGVSWSDAALFAAWMGGRLPTEAEWERACGAGSSDQWCCPEPELPRHAWYSENSHGERHRVGTREPNDLGLHDMHGNVWEWCADDFQADFYARSPRRDPVAAGPTSGAADAPDKVSRGGSFLSLSEMCRTRFRLHDPAGYSAGDLGFRMAGTPRADDGGRSRG